jgi:hypothetical protein
VPEEVQVTDSGGTMTRLAGLPRPGEVDAGVLEPLRRGTDGAVRPAGAAPHLAAGDVITWHYGLSADVLRVVRDDERGLVAWLPPGSERLVAVPRDGRALRDRTLAERAALALSLDYDHQVRTWQGAGVLRVAPTGVPWSLWYFTEDDGSFAGHYVNLELTHERPVDGAPRVHTRDLTLDLWLDADGELWLKDADELDAGVEGGVYTPEQAAAIREIAARAHHDLVAPRAWPLDEGWETWRPPAAWAGPLTLPETAFPSGHQGHRP